MLVIALRFASIRRLDFGGHWLLEHSWLVLGCSRLIGIIVMIERHWYCLSLNILWIVWHIGYCHLGTRLSYSNSETVSRLLQIIKCEGSVLFDGIFSADHECIFRSRFIQNGTVFSEHAHFLELSHNWGKPEIIVNISFDLNVPDQFFFFLLNPMIIDLQLALHHDKINLKSR